MRLILLLCLGFLMTPVLEAQNHYLTSGDSDPEARKVLKKMKERFDMMTGIEVYFDFTLSHPESEAEKSKGKLIQKGDKYVLDIGNRAVYNNNKYVWLYLKEEKEVQLNNYDPDMDDGFVSPKDFITDFKDEDYIYAITEKENGRVRIDFKPTDRNSEYAKMTLYVDESKLDLQKMIIFAKDGTRFVTDITSIKSNADIADSRFTFDEAQHPGIYIEDLRID